MLAEEIVFVTAAGGSSLRLSLSDSPFKCYVPDCTRLHQILYPLCGHLCDPFWRGWMCYHIEGETSKAFRQPARVFAFGSVAGV